MTEHRRQRPGEQVVANFLDVLHDPIDLTRRISTYKHRKPLYKEASVSRSVAEMSSGKPASLSECREFFLVSYGRSGLSWLVNCFLEVGIKVLFDFEDVFIRDNGIDRLRDASRERFSIGIYPSLSLRDKFCFRDDIIVYCVHNNITQPFRDIPAIVMVRDFRDSLYSFYKFCAHDGTSFDTFLNLRDSKPGLTYLEMFKEFYEPWSTHRHRHVVKFEDYKASAIETLRGVLRNMEIDVDDSDLLRAVSESTLEKVQYAEAVSVRKTINTFLKGIFGIDYSDFIWTLSQRLNLSEPQLRSIQIINTYINNIVHSATAKHTRKGQVGEYLKLRDTEEGFRTIETTLGNLFESFGYSVDTDNKERSVQPPTFQNPTSVEVYWNSHTVATREFSTKEESLNFLQWRASQYPLFEEFMQLYGNHDGETILDYGCGPGNDLVGFLHHTKAKKITGIDISSKALGFAAQKLRLHEFECGRYEVIQISDSDAIIPMESESVDYIHCAGALQHTSYPDQILKEFHRVLKPQCQANIMVYNRNSIWVHLYTAYSKMIVEGKFSSLPVEEAFSKLTDGENCPIARCYSPEEFCSLCDNAGFDVEFVGGYLSKHELKILQQHLDNALADSRLAAEHRAFLNTLTYDTNGFPLFNGKYAGIGGVYRLIKQNGTASEEKCSSYQSNCTGNKFEQLQALKDCKYISGEKTIVSSGMPKVLIILSNKFSDSIRNTVTDMIECYRKVLGNNVDYVNFSYGETIDRNKKYDLIIFHTLLFTPTNRINFNKGTVVPPDDYLYLKNIKSVKVMLPQDEHCFSDFLCNFVDDMNIAHVFSVGDAAACRIIYGKVKSRSVRFHRVLTGYLDDNSLARIKQYSDKVTTRPIDIFYRSFKGPKGVPRYWLGRHGNLKWEIAYEFEKKATGKPLTVDISVDYKDTLFGDEWLKTLLAAKYIIGVEGGSSVLDPNGSIMFASQKYLADHPDASFEQTEQACFPGQDGNINYTALSPRHLEACATKTCQILVEGDYNGILKPWLHYIPLAKDLSNIDQAIELVSNNSIREELIERSYSDIVVSGKYSYSEFVDFVLETSLAGNADTININSTNHDASRLKQNKTRIGILTCMWQRPELTEVVLTHYNDLKEQVRGEAELVMYAVGSEGDTSRIIAERNGFNYVEWPNQPLGAKWNAGLRAMRDEAIDAVLIVGSDDLINAPLIELYVQELARGKKFLGILDMYFFDIITRRLMHWKGYTNERKGEVIGLGRCIHRDILEATNWTIWEDWRKSSLDYSMLLVLADVLKPVYDQGQASFFYSQDHGIAALDVKLSHNINSFDYINHSTDCEALNHVTWLNKNYPGPLVEQLLGLTRKVVIEPVHAHDLHGDTMTSMALVYAKIAEKYPEICFNTISTEQIKHNLLKSKTWEDLLSLMLDKKDRGACREVLHCLLLLNPDHNELRQTLDILS